DDEKDDGGEEGQTPAPGDECLGPHDGQSAGDDERGDQLSGGRAGAGEARPETTVLRRMLGGHEHGSTPFSSDRNALDDTDDDEQDRGDDAGLIVGRQEADRRGGDADREHADDEHALASELVSEMSEDDAAQRPGQI